MRSLFLALLFVGCATAESESKPEAAVASHDDHRASHDEGDDDDEEAEEEEAEEVGPDGPSHLTVPEVALSTDPAVLARGEAVFAEKGCNACHQFGTKLVGPDLNGITERRTVPWVTRMIKHPDAMTKEDPVAKGLFRSHMVQMPNQGVSDDDIVPLIAYLASHKAP